MSKPKKHARGPMPNELRKRLLTQIIAILVVSTVLGLAFNASNPIGVRFGEANAGSTRTPPELLPQSSAATESLSPPATQVASSRPPGPPTRALPAPAATSQPQTAQPTAPAPTPGAPIPVPIQIPAQAMPATWEEVKPQVLAGQVVLVDARPKHVYEAGHIPGAISLPQASQPDEFQAFKARIPASAQIVVYCSSTTCGLARQVAEKLMHQYGYQGVRFIKGGYEEWQRAEQTQLNPGS